LDDYLECLRNSLEQDLGLAPPQPAQALPGSSDQSPRLLAQAETRRSAEPQTSSVPAPDAVDCASMHSGINAELSGEALDLCLPLLWGKLRGKV
jgi:hypothetical protein